MVLISLLERNFAISRQPCIRSCECSTRYIARGSEKSHIRDGVVPLETRTAVGHRFTYLHNARDSFDNATCILVPRIRRRMARTAYTSKRTLIGWSLKENVPRPTVVSITNATIKRIIYLHRDSHKPRAPSKWILPPRLRPYFHHL